MKTLTLIAYSLFVTLPLLIACGLVYIAMAWRDLWCDNFTSAASAEDTTRESIFPKG